MALNYSDMENAQMATNEQACLHAFMQQWPKEPTAAAEWCDSGSWGCATCPWKESAHLHPHVLSKGASTTVSPRVPRIPKYANKRLA